MTKVPVNTQFTQQIASLMPHYCDRCGFKHSKADLEVITVDPERMVCRLECTSCKNIYIFQVNSSPDGVINTKKNSLKSDITGAEIKKFTDVDEIITEEILDVVISLKKLETIEDFFQLFAE